MSKKYVVKDLDFDKITIHTQKNLRNITMKVEPNGLLVRAPYKSKIPDILEFIHPFRKDLLKSYEEIKYKLIDYNYSILVPCFHLYIRPYQGESIIYREEDEEMIVYCPLSFDIYSPLTQKLLRLFIIRAMNKRAMEFLPPLLDLLSETFSLKYKYLKISTARARWGKCTPTGIISLSCYVLLLPSHLIDYVIMHQLTHTKEIKHSLEFWELLNKVTYGNAEQLDKELKSYHSGIPDVNCKLHS